MIVSILSVFPEIYKDFLSTSIVKKAQEKGLVSCNVDSFKSFVQPKERIDTPTFGPGAGMVLKAEVVQKAIEEREKDSGKAFKVFFSPGHSSRKLDQDYLQEIALKARELGHIMLLPARYEGMDSRVQKHYADAVVSVGDFVLMGGDLPAMLFLEGFLRLIPDVIGKQESVDHDSFSGPFVDYPAYGEPVDWNGEVVPEVLRSGNHEEIRKWRLNESVKETVVGHFDWMRSRDIEDREQLGLIRKNIPNHYAALMHCQVYTGCQKDKAGTTSVTSIDIHDIARSSKTYGLKNYFVVTPLKDQQKIVQTLLGFWKEGPGFDYNRSRFDAVKDVYLKDSLESAIEQIEQQEGQKPIIIATSAKKYSKDNIINYNDQGKIWALKKPILFIFGTGQGLSDEIMEMADYLLLPLKGYSDYNHLSVRSAAAIIFDRWLGINIR